jgi:hypothetical protein
MQEVVEPGFVKIIVRRINIAEAVGKRLGNSLDITRVQVNVGISLRMHIALRAIDAGWNLDTAHEVRGQKMSRVSGLNCGVPGTAQQEWQPADFQVRAGAHDKIGTPHGCDQAGPCL